ncbi:MAG: hypothetical protein H0Z29_06670 [Candidatus Marinimicrobia bacterium]|nr:hypothetical protein [Candidatus Neomarinimicrobiota bacterium]
MILSLIFCINFHAEGGEYIDDFLQLGVSARSLAMANSTGAVDTTLSSFLVSPSGIVYVENFEINFMYTSVFSLANMNYVGIAKRFRKLCIGLNWVSLSVDGIPIRPDVVNAIDEELFRRDTVRILSKSKLKTFNDYEGAIFITIGRNFLKKFDLGWKYVPIRLEIPVGVNIKLIRKRLYGESGDGIGLDIGCRIKVSAYDIFDVRNAGYVIFGYTLRDAFGTTIYWSTKSRDLVNPYNVISFGYIMDIKDKLNLTLAIHKEYRYSEKFRFGLEATYKNVLSIRFGLRDYGWSTGAGIVFKLGDIKTSIDYSILKHDELSVGQRISCGILF